MIEQSASKAVMQVKLVFVYVGIQGFGTIFLLRIQGWRAVLHGASRETVVKTQGHGGGDLCLLGAGRNGGGNDVYDAGGGNDVDNERKSPADRARHPASKPGRDWQSPTVCVCMSSGRR